MFRFRMLGTLDLTDSQDRELRSLLRSPKLLALLGYLAIARPYGFHRRDTLVALLWPELDHVHARSALRQAVYSLREALGEGVVLGRGEDELGIDGERLWCDVRELEKALDTEEPEGALELYGGGLLNGLHLSNVPEFERWLDEEREYVRRSACDAAQLLITREDTAGNPAGAARWARRLTELSPADENAVRRLIQLLDRSGDRAGAVRTYEEFERRLARDLELEPSTVTAALIETVRMRKRVAGAAAASAGEVLPAGDGEPAADTRLPIPGEALPMRRVPTSAMRIAAVFALAVGGTVAGGWLGFAGENPGPSADAAHPAKRIVVLPFANLGPAEDAYFAAGVTEELSARLAIVDSLRILGTTSANRYRNTTKTIPEIGKELDVDYVLEGSVRWQKSDSGPARVRVTPQLVSTKDGTRLWAHVYDEPLDEIFRVQSDIAQKVVRALDVALVGQQRSGVDAVPTSNLEAYDYYLRGRDYARRGNDERTTRTVAKMFERARELDPGFALAHARLGGVYSRMHWAYFDHSAERLEMARRAVEKALELEPDLPEAHQARASYLYMGHWDYDRALREFAIAEAARPNDVGLFLSRAVLRARQGKFAESLADFERARQLDPASSSVASNSAITYDFVRDYPRAEAQLNRAIALTPDRLEPYLLKVWLYLRWDGNTQRARAVLGEAQTAGIAAEPTLLYARVLIEYFDRKYPQAIALLSAEAPEIIVSDQLRFIPRAQVYALLYGLMQRPDLERAHYESARVLVSRKVQEAPGDPRLRTALGIAYAGLGRRQEAMREAKQALELVPISKEAVKGYHHMFEVARIYTMVGEYDLATSRIEYLLSVPGQLTPAWLRMDPVWNPLRANPRFQRLVALKQ